MSISSIWSEIRPPAQAPPAPLRVRLRGWLRRAALASPLIAALTVAAIGLAALADSTAPETDAALERGAAFPLVQPPAPLIDINTATAAELATLPGLGETRAHAIILLRAQRPFRSLAELVERGLLRPQDAARIAERAAVYVEID